MKLYQFLLFIVLPWSFAKDTQEIVIINLKKEYKKSEKINFYLKSNTNQRVYFYLEGWCFNSVREAEWRPFDNDVLSKTESHREQNLWLEPNNKVDFNINSYQFLKKFPNPPDSFKIRIVYRYENNDDSANYIFSQPFIIR